MILPRLGIWSSASGKFLIWERFYRRDGEATVFCRVSLRYLKTARELGESKSKSKEDQRATEISKCTSYLRTY